MDPSASEIKPKPARKCYSLSYKLEAVEYAEKASKSAAARHFGVDKRQIRTWCSQKEAILGQIETSQKPLGNKRLEGGGRHLSDQKMETELLEWIYLEAKEEKSAFD